MADVIDDDSLLLALRDARPDSGSLFDPTSAPAQSLLNRVLMQETSPQPRIARRLAVGALGAAAVAAGVVGAVTLAGSAPSTREHEAGRATTGATGSTLRLAGLSFSLPRGYQGTAHGCPSRFTPPPDATAVPVSPPPVVGGDSYAQAASADGGCVEASLGTGYPANAQRVQIGSYSGFLWRTKGTFRGDLLTLYVVLPPAASASVGMDPGLNLYLNSTDLTAAQLEQIAESGLTN